ncbi:TetR/AcrR family transcriptional regulator [Sciscionella sediminilitoris]|uniref:TetR/AcrR family transcriptional regulator n=1 Tax=Sciscionella sediminilitoris TaxID=1445613 RepID=UPI00068FF5F5|nr:TetR/AcrR family transcriptional regulator [Sciscionella sp. SE31]
MAGQGLRERKKWQTRRRISEVATGLFFARGFDAVTVAEVAEAAEVSKMTVFNYFPRKEDLLLDRTAEGRHEICALITGRAEGESVFEVLRAQQHRLLAEGSPLSGAIASIAPFWKLVHETPTLFARSIEQRAETAAALTEALRPECATEFEAVLLGELIGAALGSIFDTAKRRIMNGDDLHLVRADQVKVIDLAFDCLERGCASVLAEKKVPGIR